VKYGAAARNIFLFYVNYNIHRIRERETHQAQSIATPSRAKILYSIHENGNSCWPSSTVEPSRGVASSVPVKGSYSDVDVDEC
jgi:hypothetical protein